MRKVILLSIILLTVLNINLSAQKDRKLSNGFSINLYTGIPSKQFGAIHYDDDEYKYQPTNIWGLQLGNRWYFSPTEKYGFGLMVNWLDFSVGISSGVEYAYDFARVIADISLLEVGPVGSYVISKDIAIDGYYNLRPTGFASGLSFSDPEDPEDEESYVYAGFGITHALGAAIRYKALNFGLEYVMGGIKCAGTETLYGEVEDLDTEKLSATNFRIKVGFKF